MKIMNEQVKEFLSFLNERRNAQMIGYEYLMEELRQLNLKKQSCTLELEHKINRCSGSSDMLDSIFHHYKEIFKLNP